MKKSLLWKVTGDGVHPSYVFGTMHVKSARVFNKLDEILSILTEVQTFMAEYHLDEVKFVQQPQDLLIANGRPLSRILDKRKFDKLHKIFNKSFGIDLYQFEHYLPLLIVNIISEKILTEDYALPLDLYLWNKSKELDLGLAGAESYQSQMAIMDKISLDDQIKMLKDIGKNPAKFRKKILKMAEWYEQEDYQQLYKYGKKSLGKYKNILLNKRNFNIANSFHEKISNESVFLAVGAGHLAGKNGLLAILKKKGLKLKAI